MADVIEIRELARRRLTAALKAFCAQEVVVDLGNVEVPPWRGPSMDGDRFLAEHCPMLSALLLKK